VSLSSSSTKLSATTRIVSTILVTFLFAVITNAQTISPVLSEYTGKVAKGSFELQNPGSVPLTAILELKSFTVSEVGDLAYRSLDKGIHVKLSATSFLIPPQQSRSVFYEASADSMPAWFVIYADIGGYKKTAEGMNIRLDLPHTVYILPKQSAAKSEIQFKSLGLNSDKTQLRIQVTNTGQWFGRVLSTQLTGRGNNWQGSGFPLYPHYARVIEVPCKVVLANSGLRLHFNKYSLDYPLSDLSGSASCAP
jgi:P pilus assembly chaperone PapD